MENLNPLSSIVKAIDAMQNKTKYFVPIMVLCLFCALLKVYAQEKTVGGMVSYVTSQHVYVKFNSTEQIRQGDTLLIQIGNKSVPALRVENLSSISCVCTPLGNYSAKVSDSIYFIPSMNVQPVGAGKEQLEPPEADHEAALIPLMAVDKSDSTSGTEKQNQENRQDLYGYLAVATYTDFTNTPAGNTWKMKYTASVNMRNIAKSNVSFESYLNFVHRKDHWQEIQQDLFNGLKIYNLSVNYKFLDHYMVLIGRKINPRISNLGANDGIQFEMNFQPFTIGIVAGSRPDYSDYGFDFSLLQFGVFVAHDKLTRNGYLQSTLAFIQQMNAGKTDRRFVYLQHSNSVIRNLTFFGSIEVDFYHQVLNTEDSTYSSSSSPTLSNLYLSLTYRLLRKLDITFSYSARKNVIYYETYKNFLDQILDEETRQGYLLRINYRPVAKLSIGVNGGYRFQKQDIKPAGNIQGYVSYSQIPGINMAATASITWLETSYISGMVYNLGISKEFFRGKLYSGLAYKYIDYRLYGSEIKLPQNVGEVNITWRIVRRLAFSLFYEGTFQEVDQFNRIYAQLQIRL